MLSLSARDICCGLRLHWAGNFHHVETALKETNRRDLLSPSTKFQPLSPVVVSYPFIPKALVRSCEARSQMFLWMSAQDCTGLGDSGILSSPDRDQEILDTVLEPPGDLMLHSPLWRCLQFNKLLVEHYQSKKNVLKLNTLSNQLFSIACSLACPCPHGCILSAELFSQHS